jgi:hypothetical protein
MCHSISVKNLHQSTTILSNIDEEAIRDLMSSLLDQIDKENDSSVDSSLMLFNASSHSRHRVSTDINEDLFQSFDDYKHSTGILVDDKEIISRKLDFL